MAKRLEMVRDIAAPPEAVYAAISDVTRMGEWSEECHACEWHEGFDGPVVGATFEGHNRNGDREWTSQGKVTEAEAGRSFVFECYMFDFHFSTWGYRIEPTAEGSRVTEWTEDLRPESAMEFSKKMSGIDDRQDRNRQTISGTLERLARELESDSRPVS
ncbi:MAG: SRPBCC family protein [Microthrixaceae bacterium]